MNRKAKNQSSNAFFYQLIRICWTIPTLPVGLADGGGPLLKGLHHIGIIKSIQISEKINGLC